MDSGEGFDGGHSCAHIICIRLRVGGVDDCLIITEIELTFGVAGVVIGVGVTTAPVSRGSGPLGHGQTTVVDGGSGGIWIDEKTGSSCGLASSLTSTRISITVSCGIDGVGSGPRTSATI